MFLTAKEVEIALPLIDKIKAYKPAPAHRLDLLKWIRNFYKSISGVQKEFIDLQNDFTSSYKELGEDAQEDKDKLIASYHTKINEIRQKIVEIEEYDPEWTNVDALELTIQEQMIFEDILCRKDSDESEEIKNEAMAQDESNTSFERA